jgi:hypothetical protein
MSTATTSTNTPYSSNSTSSAPTAPHDYVPTPAASALPSSEESGFSSKEVLMYGGGLVLTAVVTYFSTLISVNADISTNRESISVLQTDVNHLKGDIEGAEADIAKNESVTTKVGIIEVKVTGLQKQLDAHIGATNSEKGITK